MQTHEFCTDAAQLRLALAEIENAERNGFMHCLAVFRLVSAGFMLKDCRAEFSDIWERAHPFFGALDWGRGQGVTLRNRFENGRVISIKGDT